VNITKEDVVAMDSLLAIANEILAPAEVAKAA